MADEFAVAQPHYTSGEPVLFWDGKELIEVRMVDDSIDTAARAAENLGARYFFRRIGYDTETMMYEWGAWDRWATPRTAMGKHDARRQPIKTFKTNDTAPLIMWAAAKGG